MRSKGDQSRMLWCGAGMVEEKAPIGRGQAWQSVERGSRCHRPRFCACSAVCQPIGRAHHAVRGLQAQSGRPSVPCWALFPQEGKTGSSRLVTGGIARVGPCNLPRLGGHGGWFGGPRLDGEGAKRAGRGC
jgi:hypothetical protein